MRRNAPSFRDTIGNSLAISFAYCVSFSVLISLLLDLYLLHHYTPWTFVAGIGLGIVLGILVHRYAKRKKEQDPPPFS